MTQPFLSSPLWLIGCGNMAGAMLNGWLAQGADPRLITVVRPHRHPGRGVAVVKAGPQVGKTPVPALAGMTRK